MNSVLVTTTPKASVQALAFQGIMVYACFPQIRDMLLRKFGDESVLFFARPVENVQNGMIDWYSPVQGTPQKLEKLPEAERAPVMGKAAAMTEEISAYADELMRSPDPLRVTRGNILKLALSCPDENYIYVIGEQPVFVCWGFGPGTPGVEPKSLTRLLRTPAQATPAETQPPLAPQPSVKAAEAARAVTEERIARRPPCFAWLWWLLPALAACLLLCLLCTSFGGLPSLAGPVWFYGPALPYGDKPKDRKPELAVLQKEIADLEAKTHAHAAMCGPEQPAIAEKPAQTAPVTVPAKPEQELIIPKNAEDASFMSGKWACETGLANKTTGEPVSVVFEFNENGNGTGTVYDSRGMCRGPAEARMSNGELHIEHGLLACPGGGGYVPVRIICQGAAGAQATCSGRSEDGTEWKDAAFIRIR